MTFEWDDGNLAKLKQVQESGRIFYVEEIESVFADPNQIVTLTYSDPKTDEERYEIRGMSNQNQVLTVIFVVRQPGDRIRPINVWRTKQTKLKEYESQRK
ncbi:hypothetical protein GCM10028805_38310 [Spirosoma harenae]